jgi:hypothetical protein
MDLKWEEYIDSCFPREWQESLIKSGNDVNYLRNIIMLQYDIIKDLNLEINSNREAVKIGKIVGRYVYKNREILDDLVNIAKITENI